MIVEFFGQMVVAARLEDYGCHVYVDGGTLYDRAILLKGDYSAQPENGWVEVTAPAEQGFLDACNALFGTEFEMEDFAGR